MAVAVAASPIIISSSNISLISLFFADNTAFFEILHTNAYYLLEKEEGEEEGVKGNVPSWSFSKSQTAITP